jgi:recombinational DNA repair protein (RecF pathway)
MKKPKKGKTPTLICGSRGAPSRIVAKRLSHCVRCGDDITKNQECYEIPRVGFGIQSPGRYCTSCFREILEETKRDLDALFEDVCQVN